MNISNVIKLTTPFERLKLYSSSPDVALRKAIITQAIIDATNISNDREAVRLEAEAKNWIFGESEEFYQTCLEAEIEFTLVRKITKELIVLQRIKSTTKKIQTSATKLMQNKNIKMLQANG